MSRVLVVDDEVGIRELLSEILYDEGHTVELAENAEQARQARLRARPDLVLLDIWMPDTDGVSLLKEWSAQGLLDMPVIMMSGHATIDTAVEATRIGAVDFLEKPITLQKLLRTVKTALARAAAIKRPVRPPASVAPVGLDADTEAAPDTQNLAPAQTDQEPAGQEQASTPDASPQVIKNPGEPPDAGDHLGRISFHQPLRDARDAFERLYLQYHLKREHYSMTRISEITGMERTHVYRKLKQLGLDGRRKHKPEPL